MTEIQTAELIPISQRISVLKDRSLCTSKTAIDVTITHGFPAAFQWKYACYMYSTFAYCSTTGPELISKTSWISILASFFLIHFWKGKKHCKREESNHHAQQTHDFYYTFFSCPLHLVYLWYIRDRVVWVFLFWFLLVVVWWGLLFVVFCLFCFFFGGGGAGGECRRERDLPAWQLLRN